MAQNTLTVNGFTGHLLALNGQYMQSGDNHGKPTYRKRNAGGGITQCHVYFWDERDGEALAGWWMAPEVGGEQVWAHSVNKGPTPPPRGWKVPWHTNTPDFRVTMELKQGGMAGGMQRPGPPQQQQGVNKFQRPGQYVQQQTSTQVQSGYGGMQQQYGGIKRIAPGQSGPGGQGNPAQEAAKRARVEKTVAQIDNQFVNTEKAVANLNACKEDGERSRLINLARSAINSSTRNIDAFIKQGAVDESNVTEQRQKLTKFQKELEAAEALLKAAQQKKVDALKTSFVAELTTMVGDVEKLVEKTKDAAVFFTCEMVEHIKPEEAMEAKEKTDEAAKPASEAIQKARELIRTKDQELRLIPPADSAPIRESVKPLQARLQTTEKELNNVKTQANAASRKAQIELQKQKRAEEAQKQREEQERVLQWNKEVAGFCFQVGLIAENLVKTCSDATTEEPLKDAESKMLGLKAELEKKQKAKECNPSSKNNCSNCMGRINGYLNKIRNMVKEQINKDQDNVRRFQVEVSVAARKRMGDKSEVDFFQEITNNTNKMDSHKFVRFVKSLDLDTEYATILFKDACKHADSATSLTIDHFRLNLLNAYHSVSKQASLTEEMETKSKGISALDVGSVVNVVEGPVEHNNVMRCKVVYSKATGEQQEGWTTMRAGSVDTLVRYSPHYTVLAETVLTNTFDLKGFKVVRRITKDEKFLATGIPIFNKDSNMWRINGLTEQKENVWVTIQGNRGTALLKNEPFSVLQAKASESEAYEFNEERLADILSSLADSTNLSIQGMVDNTSKAKDALVAKIKEFEDMDGEGQEPSKEELTTFIKELDVCFQEQRESSQKATSAISKLSQNLKFVINGPFADLKEAVTGFNESLAECGTIQKLMGEKRRVLQKSIQQKELERRQAREKAEAEAQAAQLMAEIPPKVELVVALQAEMKLIDEQEVPTMTTNITAFHTFLTSTVEKTKNLRANAEEIASWVTDKMPNNPKPQSPLLAPMQELRKHKQSLANLKNRCDNWDKRVLQLRGTFKEKMRIDFAVTLKKYMDKKSLDSLAFFKAVAGADATSLSLNKFAKLVKKICPELQNPEELVSSALGDVTELLPEHLEVLSKASYRCMKRLLLTDESDIQIAKRVKTVEPEEIVEVTGKHVQCATTGLTRFKGKSCDGIEGYATIKGNKNSVYLKFQQSFYKVIKESVLTDTLEMANFKVVRRLKEGDYVRELSPPQLEEKSKLWRMKAQALDDGVVAWVTIKGNTGTTFLVNVDAPAPKEAKEEVKEAPTTKQEVKEEPKAEDVAMEEVAA